MCLDVWDCIEVCKRCIQPFKTCDAVWVCFMISWDMLVQGHRIVTQQGRNGHALAKVIYFSSARCSYA